jgi:poly(hydroxyalkanoate) depolymerase family esterase
LRKLHDTITRLKALQQNLTGPPTTANDKLSELVDFGSNPGALIGKTYLPKSFQHGAPLVVVLHGCTQSAARYDRSAGWSNAADEHGFALLLPEQQRRNNPNSCFNWFSPEDATRGRGEALSIRQMVAAMHARHGTDPERVFVTGLSAGGAMASVMLATYPDVFAGGAIIAGLPFGAAHSIPEAFDRMRAHGNPPSNVLAERIRAASSHTGPWPILSVWHGTNDATVDFSNARASVDQWRAIHGAPVAPSRSEKINGYPHRVWNDARGRAVIEEYVITGMGHGTPLSTSEGYREVPTAFMLDAGISSTRQILSFWGIANGSRATESKPQQLMTQTSSSPRPKAEAPALKPLSAPIGAQKIIEDALRAAGLMG